MTETELSPALSRSVADVAATTAPRAIGWTVATAFCVLTIFLLLHNPYWVRGGDSEVYLCMARSLVLGEGYRFNGQPVELVPPGWPWLLAGAMRLSPQFFYLKLVPIFALAGGLLLIMRGLLYFTRPSVAFAVIVGTSLLEPVFQISYSFLAEGSFLLMAGGAFLLALQIRSGRTQLWRMLLLIVLCMGSLSMRWTGILWWPVIGAILLRGELVPRLNRVWVTAFVSGLATLLTFFALRYALRVDPNDIDPRYDASLSGSYDFVNETTETRPLSFRLFRSGLWFGGVFWMPWVNRFELRNLAHGLGFIILALLILTVIRSVRRREWMWLAVLGYFTALCANWPHPVPRYLLPIIPLVLFAAIIESARLLHFATGKLRPLIIGAQVIFAATIFVPNLDEFGREVSVMQSDDFYRRFRGGMDESLIAATQHLSKLDLKDADLVVTQRFATPRLDYRTNGWMRAIHFLTGRAVMTIPAEHTIEPDSAAFQWIASKGARYYLYQPIVFVDGHEVWQTYRGKTIVPEMMEWGLYDVKRTGKATRVRFAPLESPLTRVPGL